MKRFIATILTLALMCSFVPVAFAATDEATQAAQSLYELGLFRGTGTNADGMPNFDLDRTPTRHEAVTMLVRLLGKDNEAKAGTWSTPFTDVDDWAKPYVGYAYANGLTTGTSETTFGGANTIDASQYLTFVLRALGYSSGTDFQWNKAWELSDNIGITNGSYSASTVSFTRGDVATISESALSAKGKTNSATMLSQLVKAGAVTKEAEQNYLHPPIKAEAITLSESNINLTVGDSKTITATVLPKDTADKTVTWVSSNSSVATVRDGKITANQAGVTSITAMTANKKTATCEVSVVGKPISYSGTGDKVIAGVNIPAGSYYAEYTLDGDRYANAKLYYGDGEYDYDLIFNDSGPVSGQHAMTDADNKAIVNGTLVVEGTGNWTIDFKPVTGSTTTNIKGRGSIVTGLFTATGNREVVSITHNGERYFSIKAIKYNGEKYDYELLANDSDIYSGTKMVALEKGAKYYFYIDSNDNGEWTIDFGHGDSLTTYAPPTVRTSSSSNSNSQSQTRPTYEDNDNNTPQETPVITEKGIDDLVNYITANGKSPEGYKQIQRSGTTNGNRYTTTITYRNDLNLLIFHFKYKDAQFVSFDYDIASESVDSVDVSGVGNGIAVCNADFDISSYTSSTTLDFSKSFEENILTQYADNYNELSNALVQIAVPAFGLLLVNEAEMSLADIGFTSY